MTMGDRVNLEKRYHGLAAKVEKEGKEKEGKEKEGKVKVKEENGKEVKQEV